jgi:hypothetical protein
MRNEQIILSELRTRGWSWTRKGGLHGSVDEESGWETDLLMSATSWVHHMKLVLNNRMAAGYFECMQKYTSITYSNKNKLPIFEYTTFIGSSPDRRRRRALWIGDEIKIRLMSCSFTKFNLWLLPSSQSHEEEEDGDQR